MCRAKPCYSDLLAEGIVGYVPCVVGVTGRIREGSAVAFAAGFYQAVGFGWSLRLAFERGCNEIGFQRGAKEEQGSPRLQWANGIDPGDILRFGEAGSRIREDGWGNERKTTREVLDREAIGRRPPGEGRSRL